MGRLKFLFITICILWLIKMIGRLLLPVVFQKMMTKAQNQAKKLAEDKKEAVATEASSKQKLAQAEGLIKQLLETFTPPDATGATGSTESGAETVKQTAEQQRQQELLQRLKKIVDQEE